MLLRILMICLCFLSPALSYASSVLGINNQKIIELRVSPSNIDFFSIKTTEHPDPSVAGEVCEGSWVTFRKENFQSDAAFERAYSLAMSAMSMNSPVYVLIGSANDCTTATTIAILK